MSIMRRARMRKSSCVSDSSAKMRRSSLSAIRFWRAKATGSAALPSGAAVETR
jgi:hypothetical protein